MITIFILGVIVMRSAGSVINDIADRHFDGHVTRTQYRPLPNQEISVRGALILFIILLLIALILVLQLNTYCLWLAIIAVGLTILYPFCKRFTYLPQVLLGMIFNGTLFPFAAIQNHLPLLAWVLYVSTIIWGVAYDTMYAMTDQPDDEKLGLKSTAILFGKQSPNIIALLQFLFLLGLASVGVLAQLNWMYWVGFSIALILSIYQQCLLRQTPYQSFKAFLNNNWLGLIIFLGIIFNS
jgi:4-hydroxybenzoate polyprenyltransferase